MYHLTAADMMKPLTGKMTGVTPTAKLMSGRTVGGRVRMRIIRECQV